MGRYFIQNQDRYGANALALFGVSANESAFGTSSIAMTAKVVEAAAGSHRRTKRLGA